MSLSISINACIFNLHAIKHPLWPITHRFWHGKDPQPDKQYLLTQVSYKT